MLHPALKEETKKREKKKKREHNGCVRGDFIVLFVVGCVADIRKKKRRKEIADFSSSQSHECIPVEKKRRQRKKESRRKFCESLLHSCFHHHVDFVPPKRGRKGKGI